MSETVRVAAVQMNSGDDVQHNLNIAGRLLADAAESGCVLAVLPENFPFMGARGRDKLQHAEELGSGPVQDFLSRAASKYRLWIVAGSIPLKSAVTDRCYGATLVIDAEGDRGKTARIGLVKILWLIAVTSRQYQLLHIDNQRNVAREIVRHDNRADSLLSFDLDKPLLGAALHFYAVPRQMLTDDVNIIDNQIDGTDAFSTAGVIRSLWRGFQPIRQFDFRRFANNMQSPGLGLDQFGAAEGNDTPIEIPLLIFFLKAQFPLDIVSGAAE